MKSHCLLTFFLVTFISGCVTKATLYPIEGPLSKQNPLPIITAIADSIAGNTRNIMLTLPDGEICKVRWSSIAPLSFGYSAVNTSGTITSGLTSA